MEGLGLADRSEFPDDVDTVFLRKYCASTPIARQEYDGPSDATRPTPDRETDESVRYLGKGSHGPLQLPSAWARENDWLRARNCVDSFPPSLLVSCHGIEATFNPYHYYSSKLTVDSCHGPLAGVFSVGLCASK